MAPWFAERVFDHGSHRVNSRVWHLDRRAAEAQAHRRVHEVQYRWLGIGLGAALLVTFEFIVMPHLAPHLSLRYHIVVSIVGVAIYVALMAAWFAGTQRMQAWHVASRLRIMYILLAAACILAAALLFHVFS